MCSTSFPFRLSGWDESPFNASLHLIQRKSEYTVLMSSKPLRRKLTDYLSVRAETQVRRHPQTEGRPRLQVRDNHPELTAQRSEDK